MIYHGPIFPFFSTQIRKWWRCLSLVAAPSAAMLALLAQARKQQQQQQQRQQQSTPLSMMMTDDMPTGAPDEDMMLTDEQVGLEAGTSVADADAATTVPGMDTRESLLALTEEIDRQLATLKAFLTEGAGSSTPQDQAVIASIMQEYSGELARVEADLGRLQEGGVEGSRQTEGLLRRLNGLVAPLPGTPPSAASAAGPATGSAQSDRRLSRFATPLRTVTTAGSASTPRSVARSATGIDFEAFPHTPTLEQLGLSKTALDVIGGERRRAAAGGLERHRAAAFSESSDLGSEPSLPHSYSSHSASMASTTGSSPGPAQSANAERF